MCFTECASVNYVISTSIANLLLLLIAAIVVVAAVGSNLSNQKLQCLIKNYINKSNLVNSSESQVSFEITYHQQCMAHKLRRQQYS